MCVFLSNAMDKMICQAQKEAATYKSACFKVVIDTLSETTKYSKQQCAKIFLNMSALVSSWKSLLMAFITCYLLICLFSEALLLYRGAGGNQIF